MLESDRMKSCEVAMNQRRVSIGLLVLASILLTRGVRAEGAKVPGLVLVEAESFKDHGGWVRDTQFVHIMGSPYLLAHGLGEPVKDATTSVKVAEAGTYKVFVRTKDWVAHWNAPGQPG